MKAYIGQFVSPKEDFANEFLSKDLLHNGYRPCLYVFDSIDENYYWVVPITSDKKGRNKDRFEKYKNSKLNWFAKAKVNGNETIFKLNNMFVLPSEEIEKVFKWKNGTTYPMKSKEFKTIQLKAKRYKQRNEERIKNGLTPILEFDSKKIIYAYKEKIKNVNK